MSNEKKVIENTKYPITYQSILNDLKKAGLQETDTLLVHSSLSSLGWVVGKEMAVCDALLEALKKGTLVMPSQTGENSDPELFENPPVPKEWINVIRDNMPPFNPKTFSTRSMGKIVECFRHYPKVYRSEHPKYSFIAKGKKAKSILKHHHLTPGFGMNSPLGKLYTADAKVLLLGVGYDSATIFHLAETLSENIKTINHGSSYKKGYMTYQDYDYDSDDFLKLGEVFELTGAVSKCFIGQAKSYVFSVRTAVDFAVKWINEHGAQI